MVQTFESTFYRPAVFHEIARVAWPPSWLGHAPFALWLMEECRPSTVVELGTHSGNSFSALCQGAVAAGQTPACYAIDTWKGDPHSGEYGEEVFAELSNYIAITYGSFAQLVRATFDEALANFANHSIDLLNIDGYHTYEASKQNFQQWLPKMSKRGVVLLHDINVREADFGVWKFWEEICSKYPSFSFLHSHGLGIVAVGSEIPPGLGWLLSPERTAAEIARVRSFFSLLGTNPMLRSAAMRDRAMSGDVSAQAENAKEAALTESQGRDALEMVLRQQAAKIAELLSKLESQGSLYAETERWKEKVEEILGPTENGEPRSLMTLEPELKELVSTRPWKAFVQHHIAPTIDEAHARFKTLHTQSLALASPAHRTVSFIGRVVGSSAPGRFVRRVLNFVIAVRHA